MYGLQRSVLNLLPSISQEGLMAVRGSEGRRSGSMSVLSTLQERTATKETKERKRYICCLA